MFGWWEDNEGPQGEWTSPLQASFSPKNGIHRRRPVHCIQTDGKTSLEPKRGQPSFFAWRGFCCFFVHIALHGSFVFLFVCTYSSSSILHDNMHVCKCGISCLVKQPEIAYTHAGRIPRNFLAAKIQQERAKKIDWCQSWSIMRRQTDGHGLILSSS